MMRKILWLIMGKITILTLTTPTYFTIYSFRVGSNLTSDQDSAFALTETKQTVCIYFTYHT